MCQFKNAAVTMPDTDKKRSPGGRHRSAASPGTFSQMVVSCVKRKIAYGNKTAETTAKAKVAMMTPSPARGAACVVYTKGQTTSQPTHATPHHKRMSSFTGNDGDDDISTR